MFYAAPGVDNQVFADFRFTGEAGSFDPPVTRTFSGINSVGGPSTLILVGPGGQPGLPPPETVTITGDGSVSATGTWNSTQGTSWDNDTFDVSSVLPAGQTTLEVEISSGNDCIGLSAAVLVVAQ